MNSRIKEIIRAKDDPNPVITPENILDGVSFPDLPEVYATGGMGRMGKSFKETVNSIDKVRKDFAVSAMVEAMSPPGVNISGIEDDREFMRNLYRSYYDNAVHEGWSIETSEGEFKRISRDEATTLSESAAERDMGLITSHVQGLVKQRSAQKEGRSV